MELVLELLDWAKGKDIGELYYEDRSGSPVQVQLTFAPGTPASAPASKYAYIQSPAIGKISWDAKAKTGQQVQAGEALGFIENGNGKVEIKSIVGGKVQELQAAAGAGVGYGQPLAVLELVG